MSFRQQPNTRNWETGLLLVGTMLTGLLAIAFLFWGVLFPETGTAWPLVYIILAAGAVLYIVLLVVTSRRYGRPVTSELLFIALWFTLELAALAILRQNLFSGTQTLIGVVAVFIVSVLNMACYMSYYNQTENLKFIMGIIPLWLTGIVALAISIIILS